MGIHTFTGINDIEENKGNEFSEGLMGLLKSGPAGVEDWEKW